MITERKIFTVAFYGLEDTMIKSKLTSKAQTTIPQAVRAALHLREGDELVYVIVEERVILTKARAEPRHDPFANLLGVEWRRRSKRL